MNALIFIAALQVCWTAPTENVDGTPLTDLAGFNIYWGTESRNYTNAHTINDPAATCYDAAVAPGDYYFAATAFDEDNNESAYSNEVLKTELGGGTIPGEPILAPADSTAYIITQSDDRLVLLPVGTMAEDTVCEAGVSIRDDNGVLAYKVPASAVTPYNASQQLVVTFARCEG